MRVLVPNLHYSNVNNLTVAQTICTVRAVYPVRVYIPRTEDSGDASEKNAGKRA